MYLNESLNVLLSFVNKPEIMQQKLLVKLQIQKRREIKWKFWFFIKIKRSFIPSLSPQKIKFKNVKKHFLFIYNPLMLNNKNKKNPF